MKKNTNVYNCAYSHEILKEINGEKLSINDENCGVLEPKDKFILLETKDSYWRKILINGKIGWIATIDEFLIKC